MPGVRPMSALSPTFTKMASEAQRANIALVNKATLKLGAVVKANGRRFHIRGRSGDRVPLDAMTDVKAFTTAQQGTVFTGAVRGVPEGFWAIVEYGSGPHLITSRKGRGGKPRTTRSGRAASRFFSAAQTLARYETGESLGALQPLRTPYGPRQFVLHPGHKSIGKPWAASMLEGRPVVQAVVNAEPFKALASVFVK